MPSNRDAEAIARRFRAIPAKVKAAVQPALDKGGDEIVARMRYLAPDDTGELAGSIVKKPGPQELSITIETENDAALFQEYGTANMDRNSFFWPSVNSLKKRVRRRVDRAIGKAVKEAWK